MKLVSFKADQKRKFGYLEGNTLYDLSDVQEGVSDLKSFLAHPFDVNNQKHLPEYNLADVVLLPVIPNPEKIICVGLNYESHRQELGLDTPPHPVLFARYTSTQLAHGEAIIKPDVSEKLDFEGELAVIIGKVGKHISAEEAFDYVAGYSCYNDASIRDWQMHTGQYTAGKNFDATGPFGPYLVTADEIADISVETVTTRLNGEQVQHAPFSDFIFDIPALIAYISTFCTLQPGDVIVTGTPGGVGVARKPRLYMKPGDQIEVEISNVGVLKNTVIAE